MIENTLSKPKQLLFFVIAIGIAILTYSNHFKNPFEFDDEHTIVNNLQIRSLKNIPNFFFLQFTVCQVLLSSQLIN